MPTFVPLPNCALKPGLVLRIRESDGDKFLRITHTFPYSVYAMWIGEPRDARNARRPHRFTRTDIDDLLKSPNATFGKISLPPALTTAPLHGSDTEQQLELAWEIIHPLLVAFQDENNLARSRFASLISQRAAEVDASVTTVHRLILRCYYFGGTKYGLLDLPPGPQPGENNYFGGSGDKTAAAQQKRRGPKGILALQLGANDFVVSEDDIADMVACLKACLRRGPTYITLAHEEYLANHFRQRHPSTYSEYIAKTRLEPVTRRQFKYYVDQYAKLGDDLAKNLRSYNKNSGDLGSVFASGPGEVYEIDSTGGRIFLVDSSDPPVPVGKPTIYLVIDRWSRYVVAVYLSLRPPSYEEVRHALLIAFTSREARFTALGVNVDDLRWPIGRVPAVICPDRGAEYLSNSMEQSVVNDLRIELTPLPPLCPDGKAIVERFIRELKRRMKDSPLRGTYAERPLDPETKRAQRKAEAAAVNQLSEAYRAIIDIIIDHNNRPHSELRKRKKLVQAGVAPTPANAYAWGLANISGVRSPPLSEDDYYRLLLSADKASIAGGQIRYKARVYVPVNDSAQVLALKSTARAKSVDIRVDKTFPRRVFVPNRHGIWAEFHMSRAGADALSTLALDEEDALARQENRLWAHSDYEARVERVMKRGSRKLAGPNAAKSAPARAAGAAERSKARIVETDKMKMGLRGHVDEPPKTCPDNLGAHIVDDWDALEDAERRRHLEYVHEHRRKR